MSYGSIVRGSSSLSNLVGRGILPPVPFLRSSNDLLGRHSLSQRSHQRSRLGNSCLRLQCRVVAETPRETSRDAGASSSSNSFSLEGLEAAYSGRGATGPPSTSQVYKPAQGEKKYLQGRKKTVQGPIRLKSESGKGRRGGKRVEATERLSKVVILILFRLTAPKYN